jgi:hypothetical protein
VRGEGIHAYCRYKSTRAAIERNAKPEAVLCSLAFGGAGKKNPPAYSFLRGRPAGLRRIEC